jgi:hypothetical protein
MCRRSHCSVLAVLLLTVGRLSAVQGQGSVSCQQTCDSGSCVQSNFSQCDVECDNTGISTVVGTCQSAIFDNKSNVSCSAGACRSAIVSDRSEVTCVDESSCGDSTILESTANCNERSCAGAHLYSSSLTCEVSSCIGVAFTPCSCCDGYCPRGMQSCKQNTLGFCSSTYLGQNCQEWGNPACDGLSTGKPPHHFQYRSFVQ